MGFLSFAFFLAGLIASYFIWVRPILRSRPSCFEFYQEEESCIAAVRAKLRGLKTKLVAAGLMISSGLVSAHDFLAPLATGISWDPVSEKVPNWAWPFILFGVSALFAWLRNVTAKEHAEVVAEIKAEEA